jgi:hypothetical protein
VAFGVVPLCSCVAACAPSSNLPLENDAAITVAATQALTGCTAALTDAGDIDEAALVASGWRPVRRTASVVVTEGNSTGMQNRNVPAETPTELTNADSYETSQWQRSGVAARLDLSRNGGVLPDRTMGECRIAMRGDEGTAADLGALLARRLGRPTGTGTRSAGGDWLTPRWFEPEIRVRYWRRPQHDVYFVTSVEDHAAIEVVAMPDRDALDQWSTSRPEAKFTADTSGQGA